ncbi:uncharacterized protein LOC116168083 [Photinus pyralis]|uniref:uncharacterized protein LOC116168083 n=1 Tax=Photinus pyralis TaxID=7054 RepID=UPI0012673DC5|nr:uncharacterized protein LOC116168083 [Photinus pyralis]
MEHERLIKKRGSVKAKLTNFQKYVDNLVSIFPQFLIEDQVVFIELKQRVDRFQGVLDEFDGIQGQIELISDDPEAQYLEREIFEAAYYGIEAKAKRFLVQNIKSDVSNSTIVSNETKKAYGVKLPIIEISTYDGEYERWLEFRDTYESLIHQNINLSSVQKFHYLKSYLGPSVLEIIASLELSAINYETAWALICDRFNNSKMLIQNHVKALFNVEKLQVESSSGLRKLVDSVAKHLRALKTLNEPVETWDTLVIYMISGPCKTCRAKHNTLLHFNSKPDSNANASGSNQIENIEDMHRERVNLSSLNISTNQVLLATVLVDILDKHNKPCTARALLDAGSQSSFLTQQLSRKLQLSESSINIKICGFSDSESECKSKCVARIKSKVNDFSFEISCLIVPHITSNLPNFRINRSKLNIPPNITLADPKFDSAGNVDMLIGADYFWDLICVGQIRLGAEGPFAQKTKLGWIISGRMGGGSHQRVRCQLAKNIDVDEQLTRFWEIEEFPRTKLMSNEERACEDHFRKTFKRDSDNKFIVTIPLVEDPDRLGDSFDTAHKRFLSLERRFDRDDSFKTEYCKFMSEYERLGHMLKVDNKQNSAISYYLPHHGVLKESTLTTKLRVVFDASCPSTSGISFNDLQMTGPTIQSDLFSILIRYRQHNYVIAADVEKMYRMCKINETQRTLQRILWRNNKTDEIGTYELQTVTYGTKSAAFLAIRCLFQLGIECEAEFPEVARAIKEDFYVDDLLTGSETVEKTVEIGNSIALTLGKAGFYLRKWVSNSNKVLEGIHTNDKADSIDLGVNENTKTLGLFWNGQRDCLFYKISDGSRKNITKRVVLSEISQLFDPLGLLSATIVLAKIILRDIWLERLEWDNSLSYSLHSRWLLFRDQLSSLNSLEIGRRVICTNPILVEMHGFSDASAYAYGACVYIKSENAEGDTLVRLVCAKSRVAPLKTQTIPRLELMAALLLSRLVNKVKSSLKVFINRVVCWCDSTIVLGWLRMNPNSLQVFVANRIVAIQEHADVTEWRHVPTQDNPADYVSRGVNPCDLLALNTYWLGPAWLKLNEQFWPTKGISQESLPEVRKIVQTNAATTIDCVIDFSKYSSLCNALLTFERFYTLLVQIEAVLNSRPLTPLSNDPSDYIPLTPSHFLIGRPLTAVPELEFMQLPENRLSHFQQVQRLQQHFWARWSLEYVSELQQRVKWRSNYEILKVGDLVVIKEDNLPPCK